MGLSTLCRDQLGLDISGLMCIPPIDEEAAMHFALLQTIARRNGIANLSMGMSDDFDIAIGLSATAVQVGSAIFSGPVMRKTVSRRFCHVLLDMLLAMTTSSNR